MERRIYTPTAGLATWKNCLAPPAAQWGRTKSAFETAVFWECGALRPRGLPDRVIALLEQEPALRGCELIAAFPGHRVSLPDGVPDSSIDVWAVVRTYAGLVSLAIDGQAGVASTQTVGEWRKGSEDGKEARLEFLCDQLGLTKPPDDALRYQLLHQTVSALLEAERIGADIAAMIVVSFTNDSRSKDDFGAFANCLGESIEPGQIRLMPLVQHRRLFLGWLDAQPCTDADLVAIAG